MVEMIHTIGEDDSCNRFPLSKYFSLFLKLREMNFFFVWIGFSNGDQLLLIPLLDFSRMKAKLIANLYRARSLPTEGCNCNRFKVENELNG